MPYIPQDERKIINDQMKQLLDQASELTDGQINYIISNLINTHIQATTLNYAKLNAMIGVLECAKLELYARMITPYESTKIQQNGGLYER